MFCNIAAIPIYKSRNYIKLLIIKSFKAGSSILIYKSRNYIKLLISFILECLLKSTKVEII